MIWWISFAILSVGADLCVRPNGDKCLCDATIMPVFMRHAVEVHPKWPLAKYRRLSWRLWQKSFTGPGKPAPCRGQSLFDYDHDGDVDLRDFAAYQNRFLRQELTELDLRAVIRAINGMPSEVPIVEV